jgi:hypothetical protein
MAPETGKVGQVSLAISRDHDEATIDIRLEQPLAGDAPLHEAIHREMTNLRAAIDRILTTPGAISRLPPGST